ncbi:MAG: hypothetical protein JRE63_10635 [Deltaproteobacteria bacterium]|jgi:hypothetical protein|nr:hypothetical protein [Deltaproteobacteria bacterium]
MRLLLFVFLTVALSACVKNNIPIEQAKDVPPERILSSQLTQADSNTGTITLVREGQLFEALCTTKIFIDSQAIADMALGEKMKLQLPEGRYALSVWPSAFCGGGLSNEVISVVKGENKVYRVGYGVDGIYRLVHSDF